MDDNIFEIYGRAIISAISAIVVIGFSMWYMFGDTGADGTMANYIYNALSTLLQ